ncbi:MAG: hypothetical protein AMJ42_05605 [Deltaproteobacteria bacterium DG_8]|nr:MAG: hypothetical protein AMJ42_05605 [Deltaproteobacteria bacterium DG_8]
MIYLILLLLVRGYNRFIPEECKTELKGIAHGADVSYSFILLINVLDDLRGRITCSCFTVKGKKTKEERLIYGRNLDYDVFTDLMPSLNTIFCYQPVKGFPFLSVAWPGYAGVVTGMSSKNLVLGSLTSFSKEKTRKGVPSGFLYRKALQYASSLKDLQENILNSNRTISNNLLIASTQGSLVLEISPTRWQLRTEEEGVLTVTNHFQTPIMSELKASSFSKPPGSIMPEEYFTEDYSLSRSERLRYLCMKGGIGIDEAIDILRDPEVSNSGTVQSLLFIPEKLELWVAKDSHTPVSLGEYIHLEDLF